MRRLPPASHEALERLMEGNARFVSNTRQRDVLASQTYRVGLEQGQAPFAVILGCSDSRAPAELVFDQGLGDLFVIRVAGNIVAPSQVGSVEFAVERFGVPLVVVMGHTHCGAIAATIESIRSGAPESRNVRSIVDRIRPSVEPLAGVLGTHDTIALAKMAIRANIRASVAHLRTGSAVLETYLDREEVAIVGAEYDLESGVVEFFEGVDLE